MAKPIKSTPTLRGENLFSFIEDIENKKKISADEKKKIKENADKLKLLIVK
ncbi:MAG: hypothetical protein WC984_04045 [Bacteroidales bacterium]|jgi:hypothetical protein